MKTSNGWWEPRFWSAKHRLGHGCQLRSQWRKAGAQEPVGGRKDCWVVERTGLKDHGLRGGVLLPLIAYFEVLSNVQKYREAAQGTSTFSSSRYPVCVSRPLGCVCACVWPSQHRPGTTPTTFHSLLPQHPRPPHLVSCLPGPLHPGPVPRSSPAPPAPAVPKCCRRTLSSLPLQPPFSAGKPHQRLLCSAPIRRHRILTQPTAGASTLIFTLFLL